MALQKNYRNNGGATQKKASTAFAVGDLITIDANGFAVPGGSGKVIGICNETITSADADYAVARDLNYTGFTHNVEFAIPVITGTATQTLVGELVDVDAGNPQGVDVTASTNDQIEVTRIIDSETIMGRIVAQ